MLGDVADELAEERVAVSQQTRHHLPQPVPSTHLLCVAGVRSQVDSEGDECLFDVLFWVVDDHGHEHRDGLRVHEHRLALVVGGNVVKQLEHNRTQVHVPQQGHQLGDQPRAHHLVSKFRVEGEVDKEAEGSHGDEFALVVDVGRNQLHHMVLSHLVLVLLENAQLLQEGEGQQHKLRTLSRQHLAEQRDNLAFLHLALDIDVLGEVEQHVETHIQQLLLLLVGSLEGRLGLLCGLARLLELLQLPHAHLIPLGLELNDAHGHVPDLVLGEGLVELGKIGE
mmetsp:Transcript_49938/g.117404  ORF Transcript_49938/g.117404 Transcript_49938/m.117404 type:complete len:281 (-) Transcript_49938:750-1592(-)